MSESPPTLRNYADLAMVRRHLDWAETDTDRDADLLLIAHAVTEQIERDLGVVWDGTTADLKSDIHELPVLGNVVSLRPPLYRIDGISREGEPLDDGWAAGIRAPDRGWIREITLTGWRCVGVQRVSVQGRWADDPGGVPPTSVVVFASWATAQEWRRLSSGATRTFYPDGNGVTIDNAWKTGDQWKRLVELFGLPPYKARVH